MNDIGKGLAGLGMSFAIATAIYVTKDASHLWWFILVVIAVN